MVRKPKRERGTISSFQKFEKCWICMLVSAFSAIVFLSVVTEGRSHQKDSIIYNLINPGENENSGHAFLTEDSVVLITGAAGFIGSELAMALHRTYSPKRIICVDRMGDRPEGQEELARFEYLRQRVFNVMQTLGDSGIFYRVDFSPTIPEYHNVGETSVLDHIFKENLDISHVVHLADPFPHSALQAVPREKEVPKAGMMEALLEQLAKHEREGRSKSSNDYSPPNFVYASSNEVYPHHEKADENTMDESILVAEPMRMLLEESQTLTTPSSLRGATKMMDEMIAKLYYDTKGIYSVGLRFFSVYGPWGVPGSPMFEMAERAVSGDLDGLNGPFEAPSYLSGLNGVNFSNKQSNKEEKASEKSANDSWKKKKHDFVYIDDAVDAILSAMQFRSMPSRQRNDPHDSPHPIIFNVASGEGHSLEDVLKIMHEFFPPEAKSDTSSSSNTASEQPMASTIGSTKRAESLLGYTPQVPLREGVMNMLAWHYDRNFPYGGQKKFDVLTQQGIAGCLPFDKECLRGTPVFPCASECSHQSQCTKSYYDEVVPLTQKLTTSCETVLYTVALDNALTALPSANPDLQHSESFLKNPCNLAFVSEYSSLIQYKREQSSMGGGKSGHDGEHYRDGSWVLIPVKVIPESATASDSETGNDSAEMNEILKLLPKLSPGLFFQSKTTKRAVYIDPNIMVENISKLVAESYSQPYNDKMEGATAMLIGTRSAPQDRFHDGDGDEEEIILKLLDPNFEYEMLESTNTRVQNSAYRMVKLAVSNHHFGNEFVELLDSRWIVHGLQSDDGRLFRCDVLGEIFQWEVTSDRSALEFIIGLHDMWSRVIAKASGLDPWWIGDNVAAVPEGKHSHPGGRRRLQQDDEEEEAAVVDTEGQDSKEEEEVPPRTDEKNDEAKETDDGKADDEKEAGGATDDGSQEDAPEATSGEGEKERGDFVADAIAQKEVNAGEEKRGESSDEVRQESKPIDDGEKPENDGKESEQQSDPSSWVGILSSSKVKYFVRIVSSSEAGIVSIENS